jgi:hypothetical protein
MCLVAPQDVVGVHSIVSKQEACAKPFLRNFAIIDIDDCDRIGLTDDIKE